VILYPKLAFPEAFHPVPIAKLEKRPLFIVYELFSPTLAVLLPSIPAPNPGKPAVMTPEVFFETIPSPALKVLVLDVLTSSPFIPPDAIASKAPSLLFPITL